MSTHEDSMRGREVAERAMLAIAERDEPAALAALNSATHGEAVWAASVLLSNLWEVMIRWCDGDVRRAAAALKAGAISEEDATYDQVALTLDEAMRRGDLDG